MVLHCLLTTSVFLTIVFSPYSLFYHKILVWVIPPLSKVEGLPTLIQWFQNFDNFLEHIVRFNLTPFYARWFLITSTPPLIYYLPHDSMFQAWTHRDQYWFTHILNPKPISSTTLYQSHVTVSIYSPDKTSQLHIQRREFNQASTTYV